MMPSAFDMWRELEQKTGKELIVNTGVLCLEESLEREKYENCVKLMKEICPENLEEMSPAEVQSKFSNKLSYKNLSGALLDKSGGVVLAHKALLAVQDLFRQQGGTLWDNCQVYQIILEGDKVKVKSAKGDVIVRSVVVCAGSWTQKLLTPQLISSLPLQPTAVNVFYWKEKVKGVYSAESGFPGLLELSNPPIYALPSLEYPGLMKHTKREQNATCHKVLLWRKKSVSQKKARLSFNDENENWQ
ncbi:peroxisomal sarcosine oxidase-like [Stegodyphus dumicola]|uniref:peroxisomal sarcosine oxidase-like n=1 Tax=Stegodyphus dumicola TaxID=202533 RepID=UPI0015A8C566|nr:peroxisomal sarcosine oxidase-like [Stegodyphus dumicola]